MRTNSPSLPICSLAGSNVAWRHFWQGQWFERVGGVYLNNGQAFNPRIDRMMQPVTNQTNAYRYSDEQLSGSWLGNAWDSFWSPSEYGAAGMVTQPEWIENTVATTRFIGIGALSVATAGLATTLWAAGLGAGIGAADAYLGNSDALAGAINGAEFGMGLTAIAGLLPAKVAFWGGVGLNAGMTGYGVYDSLENGHTGQAIFRAGVGAYFGMKQFGYEISLAPVPETGSVTLNTRLLPFRIAKRQAMRDMLAEDVAELSPQERAFYNAPNNNSLQSLKEAWGYSLRSIRTGQVLKYGETTQGYARYSSAYLRRIGAQMKIEVIGSKVDMHQWQHNMILKHKAANGGRRPKLNLNDY